MDRGLKVYLIPIVLLLAFTLPHLEQGEFRRDTVRYAAVSLNMWRTGSLLVPYLNSEKPYFNKPPLAFWIHGLALKMFGPRLAAARIPSILAAVGVIVFSMLAARNVGSDREAVVSGIVLATTYEFFRRTREISLDFWQLFFVMIAVWLIARAMRRNSASHVVLAGGPIGLALLCKPLVGLFALLIFAIWLAVTGRMRLVLWIFAGALPVALLISAPWHLYMYGMFGDKFVRQYFVQEIVGRAVRSDQASSVFYYIVENAKTYWPWLLAVAWSFYLLSARKAPIGRHPESTVSRLRWKNFRDWTAVGEGAELRLVLLAGIWVFIVFIALSLFADRKPNYALPLYPMLSWIAAWGLCKLAVVSRWYDRGFPWLIPAAAVLFLVLAIAPIRFQQPPEKNWVALVNWLNNSPIDISTIGYTKTIDQNDVSYVYLKTGRWMKSLAAAQSRASSPETMILTKRTQSAPLPENQTVLFASGPVHVISERR